MPSQDSATDRHDRSRRDRWSLFRSRLDLLAYANCDFDTLSAASNTDDGPYQYLVHDASIFCSLIPAPGGGAPVALGQLAATSLFARIDDSDDGGGSTAPGGGQVGGDRSSIEYSESLQTTRANAPRIQQCLGETCAGRWYSGASYVVEIFGTEWTSHSIDAGPELPFPFEPSFGTAGLETVQCRHDTNRVVVD